MQEFMIDLETMGTGPGSAIMAIGAIAMDFDTLTLGQEFYATINLASHVAIGGVIDPDTLVWWMRQSDEARMAVTSGGQDIREVLNNFAGYLQYVGGAQHKHIWGNGASFDNVILHAAYVQAGIPLPWNYKGDRCFRTLRALHPEVPEVKPTILHHALYDAKAQAQQLLNILRGGKP